jgi:hypothetical protein
VRTNSKTNFLDIAQFVCGRIQRSNLHKDDPQGLSRIYPLDHFALIETRESPLFQNQKRDGSSFHAVSFCILIYTASGLSILRMTMITLPLISNGSVFLMKIGFMVGFAG